MRKERGLKHPVIPMIFTMIVLVLIGSIIGNTRLHIKYNGVELSLKTENIEEVPVLKNYQPKKVEVCYGNFIYCKKRAYKVIGSVNDQKLGKYQLTYEVMENKKIVKMKRIVSVVDHVAPTLTIEGKSLTVCPNGKLKKYNYQAIDQYDGDLTSKVEKKLEQGKLVFRVKDQSQNETIRRFPVRNLDVDGPVLTLNGEQTMSILLGTPYQEPGVVALDECDGTLTNQVVVTGEVNPNRTGTYVLTYTVKDSASNDTSVERTVTVYQKNETVMPRNKTVYLTFDDGPGPATERLLNILAKYQVKATFFVTNLNGNYDHMITRAYQEGHAIGLHTYTHQYASVYASIDAYYRDLNLISEKVKNLTGMTTHLIRFPGGSSNTVSRHVPGIMSYLARDVEKKGYQYFDWNVSSGDAGETLSTDVVVQNVTQGLRNDHSIVLQHDSKGFSVDGVERIIQYGLSHGYTFTPLTMNSPKAHHRINN